MNWMTVTLSSLRWKILLLGAAAGIWGAFLHESVSLALFSLGLDGYWNLLSVAGLGLGLGGLLAPIEDLLKQFPQRSIRSAFYGGLLGAISAVLALALAGVLPSGSVQGSGGGLDAFQDSVVLGKALIFPILLGVIAGGCGYLTRFNTGNRARASRRMGMGFAGGALLGLPLTAALIFWGQSPWMLYAGLALWGAPTAQILYWWEKRSAKRWLRLLSSPGEDELFPLAGDRLTVGKHERNDIPLREFMEIHPFHCELRWMNDHYQIVDNEEGGVIHVNYRQVREQKLKPGDLVKIGSAVLQYGEGS